MRTAWRTRPRAACAEGREVLALPLAARDQHHGLGEALERLDGGVDVGALGVVVVRDAARPSRTCSMRWATPRNAAMPRRMASGAIPVHSTHAVAASTFSRLWGPRSAHLGHGADALDVPVEPRDDPALVDEDAGDRPGGSRLNQSTRPRARPARAAAPGSSAFSTAQSASVWLARMRALAST